MSKPVSTAPRYTDPLAPVMYSIIPIRPEAHLFEVRLVVDSPDPAGQQFALPAWIPGSYMIREFAKNIVELRAEVGPGPKARRIKITKTDKHSWRAEPLPARAAGPLTLTYTVYAWDLSVRCAHLDATHGFFNGTSVFLRVAGREHVPHIVDIQRPAGKAYEKWRVATALPELKAKRYGFGTYQAANYDELVDHPVEMGTFALATFTACGAEHDVVVTGRVPNLDLERLCTDFRKICEAQIRMFEPRTARAPFQRYVFLTLAIGDGYGGLEHRASTALICARHQLPVKKQPESSDDYRGYLGLVSHEYFHSWNVKRIKPAVFAPYDFNTENYTSLLWIFEGFTSYYDDLILVRTGLIDRDAYFKMLAKTISVVLRGSGRHKQSVAESSFDAWTKYYRQDENSSNAIVSYYQKGSLVALALDLHIRAETRGKRSLDDVMRALWQRFGRDFYPDNAAGLAEDGFAAVVLEATGVDVTRQVRGWAYGTRDLPLAALLAPFGIDLSLAPEHGRVSLGARLTASGNEVRLHVVYDGGAAQGAALSAGDVLVAIDGLRVASTAQLDAVLGRFAVGDLVEVHAFRRDELFTTRVKLGGEPSVSGKLGLQHTGPKAKPNSLLRGWLAA